MKKRLFLISLFIISSFFNYTYATSSVSIKIPMDLSALGLDCAVEKEGILYKCTIDTGFASLQTSIGKIITYFTFITGLAGVLYIIINGIMLSMAGLDQNLEKQSKDNIKKALIGLILLLLSGAILNFIAPWVYS